MPFPAQRTQFTTWRSEIDDERTVRENKSGGAFVSYRQTAHKSDDHELMHAHTRVPVNTQRMHTTLACLVTVTAGSAFSPTRLTLDSFSTFIFLSHQLEDTLMHTVPFIHATTRS
jgi:hypothetical protein